MGEALLYWTAFRRLARDRPMLAGMVVCPRAVPTEAIEREAHRLLLVGDGFDIFVFVVTQVDDFWVETEMKRLRDDSARRSAQQR